ncbi:hypothetical protein CP533_4941, partial [Ophiocordyceps camponoti-saundersi (nom. inval.)]
MFENAEDSHDGSESPRPLFKIRTNFVPIHKGGCKWIRRDQSEESIASGCLISIENETDAKPASTSVMTDDNASSSRSFGIDSLTSQTIQMPASTSKTTEKAVLTPPKKWLSKTAFRNERREISKTPALSGLTKSSRASRPGHNSEGATQSLSKPKSTDKASDNSTDKKTLLRRCSDNVEAAIQAAASPETVSNGNPSETLKGASSFFAGADSAQVEFAEVNNHVTAAEGEIIVQPANAAKRPDCGPHTESLDPKLN